MVKIKVTEIISDWFHTVEKEIDETQYDYFKLKATEMVWMLEGYQGDIVYLYLQIEQPKKLIAELNINHIVGNRYRTVNELF